MKTIYTLLIAAFLFSCSSDREVKKMTDLGFQLVVQKYITEYEKEYSILQEELLDADAKKVIDSLSNESYEAMRIKYIEFVSSEKNLKMIKSALAKKESLKPEQIEKLEKMLREAK